MNNIKTLGLLTLLTGLMVAAAPADAIQAKPGKAKERHGQPQAGLASQLGLSQTQADEIKELMLVTRQNMMQLKAQRDQVEAELDHLLTAAVLDESAILAAANNLAQINAETTKVQVQGRLAVSARLSPQERANMHKLRPELRQRLREHSEAATGPQRERGMKKGHPANPAPSK